MVMSWSNSLRTSGGVTHYRLNLTDVNATLYFSRILSGRPLTGLEDDLSSGVPKTDHRG